LPADLWGQRDLAVTLEDRQQLGHERGQALRAEVVACLPDLAESLDYPSKLSRNPAHIARLIVDGETQASAFLAELDEPGRTAEPGTNGAVEHVEEHGPMGPV
jgi:hypothetical protein